MGIKIGLDVGITSVGYAVLRTDDEGVPYKIETLNSVIFPAAENPKSGESLAAPRRGTGALAEGHAVPSSVNTARSACLFVMVY